MPKILVAVAILVLGGVAHADSVDTGDKNETTASVLAVGGSLVGPALVVTALEEGNRWDSPLHAEFWPMMVAGGTAVVLGPSLGNWYAGEAMSTGLKLRLAGAAAAAIGGATYVSNVFSSDRDATAGAGLVLVGLGTVTLGTILDVGEAHHAAAEHDRRLAITPLVTHTSTGTQSGLAIAGTF